MARPREFDIDDALARAMNLFWEKGYQSANLPDLLNVMGIVRGSLYKAFGSKKELFLRTLALYDETYIKPCIATLEASGGHGIAAIESVFAGTINAIRDGDRRGCLLCSSASESSFHDADIEAVVKDQLQRLTEGFAVALRNDSKLAHLDFSQIAALSQSLTMEYVGLRTMQRAGYGPEALEAAIAQTFKSAAATS